MRLSGVPVTLEAYPAQTLTNQHFREIGHFPFARFYLPPALSGLWDETPERAYTFLEDDNRGAVSPDPVVTLDGMGFHLSVKGVGSTVDPFSSRPLDRSYASELTEDKDVRDRLGRPSPLPPAEETERIITGERWLRGSPYGGQGLEHAQIALNVSERADLTSLNGFLIAPVVQVAFLPEALSDRLRTLHWYRKFRGPIVQELRLVPSNVRIYFHAKNTVGNNVRHVFDTFGLDTNAKALAFELRFLQSSLAMLTLFARTLRFDTSKQRYYGLDFHDVWLDKDAVLAPDGAVYFVDLEGIEEEGVDREKVGEKLEDQVFRSLYEFVFAYEQIEQERTRRFGGTHTRKGHFETMLTEALREDPFLRVREGPEGVGLQIRNALAEESLNILFPLTDR
jgi:hypothetical protein